VVDLAIYHFLKLSAIPPLKISFLLAKHLIVIMLILAVTPLGIKETSLQSKYIAFSP